MRYLKSGTDNFADIRIVFVFRNKFNEGKIIISDPIAVYILTDIGDPFIKTIMLSQFRIGKYLLDYINLCRI